LTWIETALPRQNRTLLTDTADAADIAIKGAASRSFRIGRDGPVLRVLTDADTFIRAVTHRDPWDNLDIQCFGDPRAQELLRQARVW
jgi:hypothetical protein